MDDIAKRLLKGCMLAAFMLPSEATIDQLIEAMDTAIDLAVEQGLQAHRENSPHIYADGSR